MPLPWGLFFFYDSRNERKRTGCELTGVGSQSAQGFDPVYGKDHTRIVFLPPTTELKSLQRAEEFMKKNKREKPQQHIFEFLNNFQCLKST